MARSTSGAPQHTGVIHLGDLTEHNTKSEWQFVRQSLSGTLNALPTFLATGNHDHGDGGTANRRWTLFSQTFPAPSRATAATLAATRDPGDLENAYYRLPVNGAQLGVLVLEWSPRHATVAWANQVLDRFTGDRVILVTHAYLYHDGTRYDAARKGDSQKWNPRVYGTAFADAGKTKPHPDGAFDGAMLWEKLVRHHSGIFLTLNGHVLGDGSGVLSSPGDSGNMVHQVLVNYQMLDEGGLGYLRLLEFLPDGEILRMKTLSPSLKTFSTAQDQHFELKLSPPLW